MALRFICVVRFHTLLGWTLWWTLGCFRCACDNADRNMGSPVFIGSPCITVIQPSCCFSISLAGCLLTLWLLLPNPPFSSHEVYCWHPALHFALILLDLVWIGTHWMYTESPGEFTDKNAPLSPPASPPLLPWANKGRPPPCAQKPWCDKNKSHSKFQWEASKLAAPLHCVWSGALTRELPGHQCDSRWAEMTKGKEGMLAVGARGGMLREPWEKSGEMEAANQVKDN